MKKANIFKKHTKKKKEKKKEGCDGKGRYGALTR